MGNGDFERVINTIVDGKAKIKNKPRVIDSWYLFEDWKNFGNNKKANSKNTEQALSNENEVFDFWDDDSWDSKFQGKLKGSALGKMSMYFNLCEGADVKIISQGEESKYYFNKLQSYLWANKEVKNGNVDQVLIKPTAEIKLNKNDQTIKSFCGQIQEKSQSETSEQLIDKWFENKFSSFRKKEGTIIYAMLPKSDNGGQIKVEKNINNIGVEEQITKIPMTDLLYEKDKVAVYDGKIRILEINNKKGMIYVDEWFEELTKEDFEKFVKKITTKGNCSLDDESLSSGCKGLLIRVNVRTEGKNQLSSRNFEKVQIYKKGGYSEGGWVDATQGYAEELGQNWEWFKLETEREFVKWRREIGIVWNGKVFKWRSF
ncbi:hypothetical protein [Mycoplasma parvum]|uniref:Uncharacterized protein n=1 Tax=Mycoplasma parvum str. Indiana TaxID=1403316 RepID=U5NC95_9MOLU|nr:hypothetical protein [Mycoplasma parvum]AGX88925.1 hypothetical protein PRV_00800 [Mycoplasma parvum str. Indiana]